MKTGGRKKGTPNKATKEVQERLEAMNCDPIEGLAAIAKETRQQANKATDPVEKIQFLGIAYRCYKELACYVAPKRKAIEHTDQTSGQIIVIKPKPRDCT